MLTEAELKILSDAQSEDDWSIAIVAIKVAHGGYPDDWYSKVMQSGLRARVAARWGSDDKIRHYSAGS